jgi:GxxExxY protein
MISPDLTASIISAAVEVQRVLGGTGLLESIYEEALVVELGLRGHAVQRQRPVPVWYKGVRLGTPLRLDLLVDNAVIVECKAVAKHNPAFATQTLTYLRLTDHRLALIINFGVRPLRPAIQRIVNQLIE